MPIQSYKELIAWQKAILLCKEIYTLTETFPAEERFGLTSQIRRASISIPSNIAEGRNRGSRKDFCHFLRIAYGSGAELETQLIIAKELLLISESDLSKASSLLDEIMRMLNVMIKKLTANS